MLKKLILTHSIEPALEPEESSSMAVNEAIQVTPLVDSESEEEKFKNDHVEYLRMARKPL